jgi:hypothetical protein
MTTDFRALCAELTQALKQLQDRLEEHYRPGEVLAVELDMSARLLDRADAALAEQPVLPTDEELDEFAVFWWGSDTDERTVTDVIECCSMTAYAHAVLARWGQPAATPIPVAERLPVELSDEELWAIWNPHDGPIPAVLRAAIAADRFANALPVPAND